MTAKHSKHLSNLIKRDSKGMDARSQRRYLSGRLRKELALADTERRIREAETTIAALKEQYAKDKAAWDKQKAAEAERAKADGDK